MSTEQFEKGVMDLDAEMKIDRVRYSHMPVCEVATGYGHSQFLVVRWTGEGLAWAKERPRAFGEYGWAAVSPTGFRRAPWLDLLV